MVSSSAPTPSRLQPWLLLLSLTSGLLLVGGAPARADSVTAESIWDKSNAIQRAQEQLPANATVTGSNCTVVNVRTGNYRYICTVHYTLTPPSGSSAPAP